MTLHRFAAKRDDNEPTIRKRFSHHGWHTEQLSGKGMPDLLCWPRQAATPCPPSERCLALSVLVDVKEPTGKPTAAQVLKWQALKDKGIPVYVARTPEDVDAIVAGTAEPWGLMEARPRKKRGKALATVVADASGPLRLVRPEGVGQRRGRAVEFNDAMAKLLAEQATQPPKKRAPRPSYTPPRTLPDVAQEAEAFAPAPCGGISSPCGDRFCPTCLGGKAW